MDVSQILRDALTSVNEADIPDDLRVVAFENAVRLHGPAGPAAANGNAPSATSSPNGLGITANVKNSVTAEPGLDNRVVLMGTELGIDAQAVDRLFAKHEGELQFVGDFEKFGAAKAAKVQATVVLLVVARQAGGYDDGPTPDLAIRKELDRHGLLDTGNYSKHLAPLRSVLNFNGANKTLNFKPKYEGKQRAKQLAAALLAGPDS